MRPAVAGIVTEDRRSLRAGPTVLKADTLAAGKLADRNVKNTRAVAAGMAGDRNNVRNTKAVAAGMVGNSNSGSQRKHNGLRLTMRRLVMVAAAVSALIFPTC